MEATATTGNQQTDVHIHTLHGFLQRYGFHVEKYNNPTASKFEQETVAYIVTGNRGTSYSLWRNRKNPRHLFVMNERDGRCRGGKIRGYEWFYEAPCGLLVPMR